MRLHLKVSNGKFYGGTYGGMPKVAAELSALQVRRLSKPGLHAVGGVPGLYLWVSENQGRSWILRVKIGAKRREIGLGSFPSVSLADARDKAREMRVDIDKGIDPVVERQQARARLAIEQRPPVTFADAMHECFRTKKRPEFRSEKHAQLWLASITQHVIPQIGARSVAELTVTDVLSVLQPIWLTKMPTAKKLRQRVEEVFNWASANGQFDGANPARWAGNLKEMLPAPGRVRKSVGHPAVALEDVAHWFSLVRAREGNGVRALEFLAMTAVRSGEVRGAVWNEFDLKAKLWTIPAERMKADRAHRVPLTDAGVALIRALPRLKGSDIVFASPRGGQLSDMTLSAAMRRIHEAEVAADRPGFVDRVSGRPAVPHGLRSTYRDWAAERTTYPREMAEIQLAHVVGSEVERAYRRGDMLEKRREMMREWERFLGL
jgi:integrase